MEFSEIPLHIYFEGSVSQNFYLGPSFYFMLCRKKDLKNIPKYTKKLPVFLYKIKTKTLIKILRHTSLKRNLDDTHREFQFNNLNSN